MKNLGYLNEWNKGIPELVKNCTHEKDIEEIRRNVMEVKCEICQFKYKIDQSG